MVEEDLAGRPGVRRRIAGAALDVAPREPLPPDSRLWALPNVTMTPHTAGASQFRAERNLDRFVDNLRRFVAGGIPRRGHRQVAWVLRKIAIGAVFELSGS